MISFSRKPNHLRTPLAHGSEALFSLNRRMSWCYLFQVSVPLTGHLSNRWNSRVCRELELEFHAKRLKFNGELTHVVHFCWMCSSSHHSQQIFWINHCMARIDFPNDISRTIHRMVVATPALRLWHRIDWRKVSPGVIATRFHYSQSSRQSQLFDTSIW